MASVAEKTKLAEIAASMAIELIKANPSGHDTAERVADAFKTIYSAVYNKAG